MADQKYCLGKRPGPDPFAGMFEVFKPSLAQSIRHKLGLAQKSVSYKYGMPAVYNQGQFGTCVAHANAAMRAFYLKKRLGINLAPSRAAIYSQAKHAFESNDIADDGLIVSDGIMVEEAFGFVDEAKWPYPPDGDVKALLSAVPTTLWQKPDLYKQHLYVENDVDSMKMALAKHGPIIIGLDWQNSWFQTGPDGVLPTPDQSAGGHCVLIVGYDDYREAFEVRNSWGSNWANGGYCYLPYSFASDYHSAWPTDVWVVSC